MKRISVLFVAIFCLSMGVAKAQKVASMDYQNVLESMPEAKKLSDELDTFGNAKKAELQKQAETFQTEVEQYQKTAGTLTEAQRKAKEEDLGKKQQNLQQLQAKAQNDLGQKRETALKPMIDKLNAAVAKVAKANGYEFIIDASALIYKGGADATAQVKKELGL